MNVHHQQQPPCTSSDSAYAPSATRSTSASSPPTHDEACIEIQTDHGTVVVIPHSTGTPPSSPWPLFPTAIFFIFFYPSVTSKGGPAALPKVPPIADCSPLSTLPLTLSTLSKPPLAAQAGDSIDAAPHLYRASSRALHHCRPLPKVPTTPHLDPLIYNSFLFHSYSHGSCPYHWLAPLVWQRCVDITFSPHSTAG